MSAKIMIPVYLEGNITDFPQNLQTVLDDYHRIETEKYIPCSANAWPIKLPHKITLFASTSSHQMTEWIIAGTNDVVNVGRFEYWKRRQLLVVQHASINQGMPCFIECHKKYHGVDKPKANAISRWKVWDPSMNPASLPEIHKVPASNSTRKSLIIILKVPRLREIVAAEDADTEREQVPSPNGPNLISESTPPLMKQDTTMHDDETILIPSDTEDEMEVDIVKHEGGADVTGGLQPQPWAYQTFPAQFPHHIDPTNPFALAPTMQNNPPLGQSNLLMNNLSTLPPPAFPYPSPSLSIPTWEPTPITTAPTPGINIAFHFKHNEAGVPLRIRPYEVCNSVRMLYSQAASAGIATHNTTLLVVQVNQCAARTVVKGDEEDFAAIVGDVGLAHRAVSDAGPFGLVAVKVWPFEWDEN